MSFRTRSSLAMVSAGAALLLLVLAVYVLVLATAQALLSSGTALSSPGLGPVLIATVAVALLVQPAYRRLRTVSRHAFGLSVTEPFELLRRLPGSATGELPAQDMQAQMVRVLAEGLRTSRCELWLVVTGGYRLAASWPTAAHHPELFEPHAPEIRLLPGEHRQPIRHDGQLLAELRLRHQPPRDLSRLESRLLDAYADQSGQIVSMLAVRASLEQRGAELAERYDVLREANAQLQDARTAERRLLERDLHDGAQQRLLVLALGVELARQQVGRSSELARATLRRILAEAYQARAAIDELSGGLTPRLLRSAGLVAALRAALAGDLVPVVVHDLDADAGAQSSIQPDRPPMPPDVAEALFYVALEAIQNATKHAEARQVRVAVGGVDGAWSVAVTDHGEGFHPLRVRPGAGLANMHDRITGLGGRLDVDSAPGRGTRVSASVPCDDSTRRSTRRTVEVRA